MNSTLVRDCAAARFDAKISEHAIKVAASFMSTPKDGRDGDGAELNRGSGSIPRGAERPAAPGAAPSAAPCAAARSACDALPDARDGLNREERLVLYVLREAQNERGGRNVPTAMLWGRVCEHFYISPEELTAMLARLGALEASKGPRKLR
jgi:hypothetical protein